MMRARLAGNVAHGFGVVFVNENELIRHLEGRHAPARPVNPALTLTRAYLEAALSLHFAPATGPQKWRISARLNGLTLPARRLLPRTPNEPDRSCGPSRRSLAMEHVLDRAYRGQAGHVRPARRLDLVLGDHRHQGAALYPPPQGDGPLRAGFLVRLLARRALHDARRAPDDRHGDPVRCRDA